MIEALSEVAPPLCDAGGKYDKAASDHYHNIQERIAHVPGPSLVAAIQARSAKADNEQMARLSELLWRHPGGEIDRGRPFNEDDLAAIRALVKD